MSRQRSDFDRLDFLGSGSFGRVFKVRHRVDGRTYALKSVRIPGTSERDLDAAALDERSKLARILREARVLANLNHERIVRYYSCWVEPLEEDEDDVDLVHADAPVIDASIDRTDKQDASNASDVLPGRLRGLAISGDHFTTGTRTTVGMAKKADGPDVAAQVTVAPTLTCNICRKLYGDYRVSLQAWHALDAGLQPLNLCTACYRLAMQRLGFDTSRLTITPVATGSLNTMTGSAAALGNSGAADANQTATSASPGAGGQPSPAPTLAPVKPLALFILTEFCELTLLDACLAVAPLHKERTRGGPATAPAPDRYAALASDPQAVARIWALFWQVVEGLAYIHSVGVTHRDLKPSNIFATNEGGGGGANGGGQSPSSALDTPLDSGGRGGGAAGESDGLPLVKIGDLGLAMESGRGTGGASRASDTGRDALSPAAVANGRHLDDSDGDDDDDDPHTRLGVGTALYMAPEGAGGRYGPFSDMYALGLVAFEMFARLAPPQAAGGPAAAPQRHHRHPQPAAAAAAAAAGSGWASLRGEPHTAASLRHPPPALDDASDADWHAHAAAGAGAESAAGVGAVGGDASVAGHAGSGGAGSVRARTRLLAALRAGCVPRSFLEAFPLQAQLISNLMQTDPAARPSASDLLRWKYFAWPRPALGPPAPEAQPPVSAVAVAPVEGRGARARSGATSDALRARLAGVPEGDASSARDVALAAIEALEAWEQEG